MKEKIVIDCLHLFVQSICIKISKDKKMGLPKFILTILIIQHLIIRLIIIHIQIRTIGEDNIDNIYCH